MLEAMSAGGCKDRNSYVVRILLRRWGLRWNFWTGFLCCLAEWSRFSGQLFKHLQAASRSKSQGAIYPFLECNRCLLQQGSVYLSTSRLASSPDLYLPSFTSSRLSALKNDSATASPRGFPGLDIDRATPCDSRHPWSAREVYWDPRSSWNAGEKPSGGPSLPTACPSASMGSLPVTLPDIEHPTTLRCRASIAAARQSRPPSVSMWVMSPTQSLFPASTSKTRLTRLARGPPFPAGFARPRLLVAPLARGGPARAWRPGRASR